MNKKTLILYQYNKFNNDLQYIKEYYNKNEIEKDFNIKVQSIRQYIVKDIDKITSDTKMLDNSYFLMRA